MLPWLLCLTRGETLSTSKGKLSMCTDIGNVIDKISIILENEAEKEKNYCPFPLFFFNTVCEKAFFFFISFNVVC